MPSYFVAWVIDEDAGGPVEAAVLAQQHAQAPTTATYFEVLDTQSGEAWGVDLQDWEGGDIPKVGTLGDGNSARALRQYHRGLDQGIY